GPQHRLGLGSGPVDADDQAEAAAAAGLHAGQGVLHDRDLGGGQAEPVGGLLEQGRVGFAGQAEPGGVVAVDEHVEQVQQAGGGDDGPAVPAGRDDGGAAAALAQLVQQGDGGGEGGHAVLG